MNRHAEVVEERPAGHDDLGVAVLHGVLAHHCRLDATLDQEAQQAQGDVEHHLHVHPGMVRHPEALGGDLRHVPQGAHALVRVDRAEEALQLAVASRGRVDLRLRDRLRDRSGANIWPLCFHVRGSLQGAQRGFE
jgi:hypothetical protein